MAATAILAASCGDRQVLSPGGAAVPRATGETAHPSTNIQRVSCTGRRGSVVLQCGIPKSKGSRDLIMGGQGVYVTLTSSNVVYDGGVGTLDFDVTVTNLIPQALGTNDGSTPDGTGVNVFFDQVPTVTGGTGSISVANPTGTGTFTGANQPYFQYPGSALGADNILSTNETSDPVHWTFNIDPTVDTFEFGVYVSANVHYPNGYVDIDSSAASGNINQSSTESLSAVSRSAVGNAVPGSTVTFSSSAPAVASVDANTGTITAVAPGISTITASSTESTTGTYTVQVCPNLAVGEAYSTSGADAASICLGGNAGVTEYTVEPLNLSPSSTVSLTITGTGVQAVTGPPSPDRIPASGLRLAALRGDESTATDAPWLFPGANAKLAARRAAVYDAAIHDAVAPEVEGGPYVPEEVDSAASGVATADGARERLMWYPTETVRGHVAQADARDDSGLAMMPPAVPAVGDYVPYNTNTACSGSPSVRTGQVRSVSAHAIIASDTMNPAGGFTTAQYDSIALEFDSIAYAADSVNFGPPTDIDGNGRVILFFTRAMNELSPPASSTITYGQYASKDVFGTDDCNNSNGSASAGAEIIYMLVPDPTGAVNSNVRTVSLVRGNAIRTAGHELEHLTNGFARAYVTGASFFESAWLDEGLASIAEELMFYQTAPGLAPRGNIVLSTLTTGPNASRRVAAFNNYANLNFGNMRGWLQRPDTAGIVNGSKTSLAARGLTWGYLRYAADRVNGSDATFFNNLVRSNLEGLPNIQNAIGGSDPLDWIRDFEIALYADDNAFSVATKYQTPSWNYRSVYGGLGGFPLLARPLTNNVALPLSYKTGGGSAYARVGVPASSWAKVTLLSGSTPPPSTVRLSVLRTK